MLVIFGASGDLTRRKLLPAIEELGRLKLLPENFGILGIGRTAYSDESYREMISTYFEEVSIIPSVLHYHAMDPSDPSSYPGLKSRLEGLSRELGSGGNYIFYLATPPSLYAVIPSILAEYGLLGEDDHKWRRVIVEKPFGTSLASARKLNPLCRFCKDWATNRTT